MIRILAVGDVFGSAGLKFVSRRLWKLRRELQVDFTVVNGENVAGTGIYPAQAEDLFQAGADVITLGNHAFKRRDICDYLDDTQNILRPANFSRHCPGSGWVVYQTPKCPILVVNLQGRVNMEVGPNSPFDCMDEILEKQNIRVVVVDFHAEATSEKTAMAYWLDGRVSALFGTHTHVQTADERVFPRGTGYITDIGMTGPVNSCIGSTWKECVAFFRGDPRVRFENAGDPAALCGALFEVDEKTGKCAGVTRIRVDA